MLQTFNEFEQINRMLSAEEEEGEKKNGDSQKSFYKETTYATIEYRNQHQENATKNDSCICTLHTECFCVFTIYYSLFTIYNSPRWKSLKKLDTPTQKKAEQTEAKRINLVAIFIAYLWKCLCFVWSNRIVAFISIRLHHVNCFLVRNETIENMILI